MSKPTPPPLPDLDWSDLPELKTLPWEELKLVPFTRGKWYCQAADCTGHAKVKDFGLYPVVYVWRRWVNVERWPFYCGKHYRIYEAHGWHHPAPFPLKPAEQITRELKALQQPVKVITERIEKTVIHEQEAKKSH